MKQRHIALIVFAVLLALSGFGFGTIQAQGTPTGTGYLRIIQAAPNVPTVDVYINTVLAIANIRFGDATDFVAIPAGKYVIDLRPAGALKTQPPVYTSNLVIPASISVNVVALGLLQGQDKQAFYLTAFVTDRSATNGKARVEIFHASPDAPAVDILSQSAAIVSNLDYGKSTDAALTLDPKTYDLKIVAAGTTAPNLIALNNTKLLADTIYTILAVGQISDKTLQPLVLVSKVVPPVGAVPVQTTPGASTPNPSGSAK